MQNRGFTWKPFMFPALITNIHFFSSPASSRQVSCKILWNRNCTLAYIGSAPFYYIDILRNSANAERTGESDRGTAFQRKRLGCNGLTVTEEYPRIPGGEYPNMRRDARARLPPSNPDCHCNCSSDSHRFAAREGISDHFQ